MTMFYISLRHYSVGRKEINLFNLAPIWMKPKNISFGFPSLRKEFKKTFIVLLKRKSWKDREESGFGVIDSEEIKLESFCPPLLGLKISLEQFSPGGQLGCADQQNLVANR